MTEGTVKFFNNDKGFGFITPDNGGSDAFVHISAVQAAGMQSLNEGQRVSYDLQDDRRGKQSACNLAAL
ncbi:cold-shock protein [Sphingomicrobium arenosum]|uniref:cold-shock protein n=1 Tax=Sphingomicrobium arenosum TaxID=2233861 RepID=UPI00223FA4E1|nr:cold-shock protein [Sphingomicrobium arenosum]